LDTVASFLETEPRAIQGDLVANSDGPVEPSQIAAWSHQIDLLQTCLPSFEGRIYFEYSIPRMGKRIDVVLATRFAVCVLEFKVGSNQFDAHAHDQVWDYALDLKNFHETSHHCLVAPILIASEAQAASLAIATTPQNDNLLFPMHVGSAQLGEALAAIEQFSDGHDLDPATWEAGRYRPTPSIIEAALALYRGHSVEEISRSDASSMNLHETSDAISEVITLARENDKAAIQQVSECESAHKSCRVNCPDSDT